MLEMKALEEKKKNIQARLDGRAPLFDESERGKYQMIETKIYNSLPPV